MRLGHDKLLATKNIANTMDLNECIQHIKNDVTSIVESSSINQNLSNAINYSNYLKYLQIVSSQSITNSFKCAEGLNNVIEYLNNSQKWYQFLNKLYGRLSQYEMQIDNSTCKNLINNITQEDENKQVANTGLAQSLKGCYPQEYNDIKNIILDSSKLNALIKLLDLTSKHELEKLCDNIDKAVIKGQYVKLSDIINTNCFQSNAIEIFALNKVFVDSDLDKTGKKIQLSIIAPIWEIQGTRKIILDGKPAEAHNPAKARDGFSLGSNGEDGKPGLPGGSAGNFLGIGERFVNGQYLTISANGGKGGPGQDGGDGANGIDGKTPPTPGKTNALDWWGKEFVRNTTKWGGL